MFYTFWLIIGFKEKWEKPRFVVKGDPSQEAAVKKAIKLSEIFVSQIFYNFFQFFFSITLLYYFFSILFTLKKPSLDHTQFSNYSPFSNLTFISKAIERSVGNQLISYFNKNHESEWHI